MPRLINRTTALVVSIVTFLALISALFPNVTPIVSAQMSVPGQSASPGDVWGFGSNNTSQLGFPSEISGSTPLHNPNINGVTAVAAGGNFTLALKSDGKVMSWGNNSQGQLGNGTISDGEAAPQQVKIPDGVTIKAIAAGDFFGYALAGDGTVYAWGFNGEGQLGNGNSGASNPNPAQVKTNGGAVLQNVIAIAAGSRHCLALTSSNNTVWAWGFNQDNQVGFDKGSVDVGGTERVFAQPVVDTTGTGALTGVTFVAAGGTSSFAIKSGKVLAWGNNRDGQLGNDSAVVNSFRPVEVDGSLPEVTMVSAGSSHVLARTTSGDIWTWGNNGNNQLGRGSKGTNYGKPDPITGLTYKVSAVAAGRTFSVALKDGHTIVAWGSISGDVQAPTLVGGLAGVTAISSSPGANHVLAIKPDNIYGRITDSNNNPVADVAVQLSGTPFATQTDKYGNYAFGEVTAGGTYTVTPSSTCYSFAPPNSQISNLSGSASRNFTVSASCKAIVTGQIIDRNGANLSGVTVNLKATGSTEELTTQTDVNGTYRFEDAELIPTATYEVTPSSANYTFEPASQPPGTPQAGQAKADFTGTPKLADDQNVLWSWGTSNDGRLGHGTKDNPTKATNPVQVNSVVGISQIAAGGAHSLALRSDGKVLAWGRNVDGELGNGKKIKGGAVNTVSPVTVNDGKLTDVTAISAGFAHSLALVNPGNSPEGGTVWAWGDNNRFQLGTNDQLDRNIPAQVKGPLGSGFLDKVIAIDTGLDSMALRSDGTVWRWGQAAFGQLGDGSISGFIGYPVQVKGPGAGGYLDNVTAIATNGNHALALRGKKVWAWGSNEDGQLGKANVPNCSLLNVSCSTAPLEVGGLPDVIAISAGGDHSIALAENGEVWAWGSNKSGQLGRDFAITSSSEPKRVEGLKDIVAVDAGNHYNLARDKDGNVWAWGENGEGQLGNTNTEDSFTPVKVIGIASVTTISAGGVPGEEGNKPNGAHSLAVVETSSIEVTVKDAAGNGVDGVTITLSGAPAKIARTKDGGKVKFENVALHGNYVVKPSSPDYTFTPPSKEFPDLTSKQVVEFIATPVATSTDFKQEDSKGAPDVKCASPKDRPENPLWNCGTLTQEGLVFSSKVDVTNETTDPRPSWTIKPKENLEGRNYGGIVSKTAFDLANPKTEMVRASVNIRKVTNGNGETIFSVGSDAENYVSFVVQAENATSGTQNAKSDGVQQDNAGAALNSYIKLRLRGKDIHAKSSPVKYDRSVEQQVKISVDAKNNKLTVETSVDGGRSYQTRFSETVEDDLSVAMPGVGAELSAGTPNKAATSADEAVFDSFKFDKFEPVVATLGFARSGQVVSEGARVAVITVARSGDVSSPVEVEYATKSDQAFVNCDVDNGQASERCDYSTATGVLSFAANEPQKTFTISISDDRLKERDETINVLLFNPVGASIGDFTSTTVTIKDDDEASASPSENPYRYPEFFVRQHYLDFLSREPDAAGEKGWLDVLAGCGPTKFGLELPADCDRARVEVSSAFYRSPEFTDRGYFVYRLYDAALGRLPKYAEFVPDTSRVSGSAGAGVQQQNIEKFVAAFMQRSDFTGKYAVLLTAAKATEFIAELEKSAGLKLPETVPAQRQGQPPQFTRAQLIAKMASGEFTPQQTLKAFVEQQAVYDKFYPRGFVAMQYFGYLRRDPEKAGYDDWVDVYTNGRGNIKPGDYRHMIFGFIYSTEYRSRFGRP